MNKRGSREVMNVTLFDLISKKPVIFFDTLKVSNVTNDSTQTSATGGWSARKLITWDHSRVSQLAIQDALISDESLALLSGSNAPVKGAAVHHKHEYLFAKDATGGTPGVTPDDATLTITAAPTSSGNLILTLGNEAPITVPVLDTETVDEVATKVNQAINGASNSSFTSTVLADVLTITTTLFSNPSIVFNGGVTGATATIVDFVNGAPASGGQIDFVVPGTLGSEDDIWYRNGTTGEVRKPDTVAGNIITIVDPAEVGELFYPAIIQGSTVTFSADRFPGYYRVVGETLQRRQDNGLDEPAQFIIEKAKLSSNFSFNLSADGDPSVFDFTFDVETPPYSSEMYKIVREDLE